MVVIFLISYSNMTSFTKMLPLKPSLVQTLKRLTVDSVDFSNSTSDATENVEKFMSTTTNIEVTIMSNDVFMTKQLRS